jgi:signal transduction histidine kinase
MSPLKFVLDLVGDTQKRNSFGDIDFLLARILDATHFDGLILWLPWLEEYPKADGLGQRVSIYAAASLFKGRPGQHVFHALSDESDTAKGIAQRRPWVQPTDAAEGPERRIVEHFGIRAVAGIPFHIGEDGETSWRRSIVGSLNFYRCGQSAEVSDKDLQLAEEYTSLFTFCFTGMAEVVGRRLIENVKRILAQPGTNLAVNESLRGETIRRVCVELEREIATTLPCREVCLQLLGEDTQGEVVFCPAGIWPWDSRAQITEFRRGYGITGACFRDGKTLLVGDAIRLTREGGGRTGWGDASRHLECVPPFYPEDAERAKIEKDVNGDHAPVSVIAIPLQEGRRTIGVLRCAAKSQSPYFFGLHEVFFLEQVAALIAEWFGRQIAQFRREKTLKGTRAIVEAVTRFIARVEKLTAEGRDFPNLDLPDLADTWLTGLPPLSCVCFRGCAPGRNVYLRQFAKPNRNQGPRAQQSPPGFSWRAYEKRIREYFEGGALGGAWPEPPWPNDPGVGSAMVFPLYGAADEIQGCVEVVSPAAGAFSEEDRHLCYLFSKMSRFVSVLQHHVKAKSAAVKEQREAKEAQERSFKLLAHQVKTPLSTALISIERLEERAKWKMIVPDKLRESAFDARRAVMRAWRVAQRMRVFSDIATEGAISKIDLQPVLPDELLRRLEEMAQDHQYRSAAKRKLTIEVIQTKNKEEYAAPPLIGDIDLIEQAAEILLENAVKYGDERSRVEIVLSTGSRGRSQMISVRNSGKKTPLRSNEVRRAMEFGVRLDRALSTKQMGWGAGLFLARHIMKAHSGELLVAPTSDRDITTFTLSIPTGLEP